MQFKHPELLWALFLLLIPIIIHLFQLRRFKKTPFTNVKFLKRVVSESRKSSTIKRWLLLFTRLAMIGFLVLAFAQPFTAKETALVAKEYVVYLDNSYSMQASSEGGTLLENLIQDFIKSVSQDDVFTLFTNDKTYVNVTVRDIKNELLALPYSKNQLPLSQVLLTAETYFNASSSAEKITVLLSDFQSAKDALPSGDAELYQGVHFVKAKADDIQNISIDTLVLTNLDQNTGELLAELSANTAMETTPVSLYNGSKLIAKTAATFNKDNKAVVRFSIPAGTPIAGKVVLSDNGLGYDNQFYFNLDSPEKIKVLAVEEQNSKYLSRIFTADEFSFDAVPLKAFNYGSLDTYNFVVLNELERIPQGLTIALKSFTKQGGHIAIIPAKAIDIPSYNALAGAYHGTSYQKKISQVTNIANINFGHPIFANVFDKEVQNFQYPKVQEYYSVATSAPVAIALQNNAPFLFGATTSYFFSAALSVTNSNFVDAPLIVPSFYTIGRSSLKLPSLYTTLGQKTVVELPISLGKDNILTLQKAGENFIPLQQVLPQKVQLTFGDTPKEDGVYAIMQQGKGVRNISFNYDRSESILTYLSLETVPEAQVHKSVSYFFEESNKDNYVSELWKWFAVAALLFLLLETLFLKVLK